MTKEEWIDKYTPIIEGGWEVAQEMWTSAHMGDCDDTGVCASWSYANGPGAKLTREGDADSSVSDGE